MRVTWKSLLPPPPPRRATLTQTFDCIDKWQRPQTEGDTSIKMLVSKGVFTLPSHILVHSLSVGHGSVDPNRHEFENFEDRSVEEFM